VINFSVTTLKTKKGKRMKKFISLLLGVTFFIGMSTTVLSAADMKSDANKTTSKCGSAKKMEMKADAKCGANKKPEPKKSAKCGAGKCGDAK